MCPNNINTAPHTVTLICVSTARERNRWERHYHSAGYFTQRRPLTLCLGAGFRESEAGDVWDFPYCQYI